MREFAAMQASPFFDLWASGSGRDPQRALREAGRLIGHWARAGSRYVAVRQPEIFERAVEKALAKLTRH